MNKKDLIVEWLKKHEIGGNKAWWDGSTYYSLTLDHILDIVNDVNQKKAASSKEGKK